MLMSSLCLKWEDKKKRRTFKEWMNKYSLNDPVLNEKDFTDTLYDLVLNYSVSDSKFASSLSAVPYWN